MEVANASLYDGSTATAEAVLMAQRITKRSKAILSGGLHPHYCETVETVAELSGKVVRAAATPGRPDDVIALIDDQNTAMPQKKITDPQAVEMVWRHSQCVLNQTSRCPLTVLSSYG